jgi:hypothetical protein
MPLEQMSLAHPPVVDRINAMVATTVLTPALSQVAPAAATAWA